MSDEFSKLYDFVELAEKNRKYPTNTAHGRRAALKLFDTVLHADERESLDLIQERIDEIFLSLITKHKQSFSVQSLTTYKGRFLNLIKDYQRFGKKPDSLTAWQAKNRPYVQKQKDIIKDTSLHSLSLPNHRAVHKLEIALESGEIATIETPATITPQDINRIKHILEALGK